MAAAAALGAAAAMVTVFPGCDGSRRTSPPSGNRGTGSDRAPRIGQTDPQRCDDLLDQAVNMLQPDRLGISAERKLAVGRLNEWAIQCGNGDADADADELPPEFGALLPEGVRALLADAHFSGRDCNHVRTAFLFQRTLDFVTAGADDDLSRTVKLFDHVVRTVELVERRPDDLPLTPYEIMLFGKGTAEDRAWVFVGMVRQMRLDAVIVRPAAAAGGDPAATGHASAAGPGAFLVGVLLEENVHLFDPRVGTPVPGDDDDGKSLFVKVPATWDAAARNPELLGRLSVPAAAGSSVQAPDLESPRIELVGDSSVWAPRMKRLQSGLAGELSAVIYDPLLGAGGESGMVSRVAEAGRGRWDRDAISVWQYPEQQLAAFEALDEQRPHELQRWLKAPFPIVGISRDFEPRYGAPDNELLKNRTEHLLGDLTHAITKYTGLRGLERALVTGRDPQTRQQFVLPEAGRAELQRRIPSQYREIHRRAAEQAHYWLGLAQYQNGQHAAAAGTLTSYLDVHGAGSWARAARELRSICLAESGQVAAALAELRELAERDPEHPGRAEIEWLIRRWEAIQDGTR
ncbi:MAG TPA: hypothetical protein VML55_16260 [Planctomycetaceae bacterium]|nr:hypothetical protein [Planctomycetaceae bacterium]